MKILHEKSPCCRATIQRFGKRRRRCSSCGKTWSVWHRQRGPNRRRTNFNHFLKVFAEGYRVKNLTRADEKYSTVKKRFSRQLKRAVSTTVCNKINGDKLILLIDAQWHYFKKELWTLYLLAIKSIENNTVDIMDPILMFGKENSTNWKKIINCLPDDVKKRIVAMVSDGIRGINHIAESNNWILQRCHFHLLSMLQKMRGKRLSTPGRLVREEIFNSVKLLLTETSARRINLLRRRLQVLVKEEGCPKRMKYTVNGFLRDLAEFRSYLVKPELNLPTTINVIESVNSITRGKTSKINSPGSWLEWTTMAIRIHSKFNCKGAKFNRN
jgi:hypothetical protein